MRRLLLLLALIQPASADEWQKAKDAYDACIVRQVARFLRSCEPAEVVAVAVLTRCDREERKLTIASGLSMNDAEVASRSLRAVTRDGVIAGIVEYRLDAPCK